MNDEDSFQSALDANPEDHTTRLVFADWLEERGDVRAEGYRAMGVQRRFPRWFEGAPAQWYNDAEVEPWHDEPTDSLLPKDWFAACEDGRPYRRRNDSVYLWHYDTRRTARDAAAMAFAKLPTARRTELLNR